MIQTKITQMITSKNDDVKVTVSLKVSPFL